MVDTTKTASSNIGPQFIIARQTVGFIRAAHVHIYRYVVFLRTLNGQKSRHHAEQSKDSKNQRFGPCPGDLKCRVNSGGELSCKSDKTAPSQYVLCKTKHKKCYRALQKTNSKFVTQKDFLQYCTFSPPRKSGILSKNIEIKQAITSVSRVGLTSNFTGSQEIE